MTVGVPIAPSPGRGRGNGPETRPGVEPSGRGDVTPNLPALAGAPALQGGEEVRHLDLWRLYHYGGFRDLTGLARFVDADDPDAEPKPILLNGRYVHLALAERGGGCVFLGGGRCRVHSFKPPVCRFYPFVYVVRGDGEVDIEVNERAVGECPGLVLDDRPIDPGIADYPRRVARARIAELSQRGMWIR
jgi:Fe-S-cluster containining protein